jgi:hypothetical protein
VLRGGVGVGSLWMADTLLGTDEVKGGGVSGDSVGGGVAGEMKGRGAAGKMMGRGVYNETKGREVPGGTED